MSDAGSEASTLGDRPVYFRPFTRDTLQTIRQRMEKEKMRRDLEKLQEKELGGVKGKKEPQPRHKEDDTLEDTKPDPKLEQGVSLPIRLSYYFNEDFANIPLEDIDPFYANIPSFVLITKKKDIFRFSATDAMYCLTPFNPVRLVAIAILTHGLFTLIIITTILSNCYVMIMPSSPFTESTEVVFTAIYTFESAVKVIARGFALEKFTYLRDAWNWLDFVVIAMAYITMGIDLGSLAALRTCRVFRALKTVAIVPGLKTIVGAVIESVKNLRDVIILTVFALSVFGLIGLQIYMGVLTQKCVKDFPEDGSAGEERDINWHQWNLNYTNWYPFPPPEEYGAADYPLCGNSSGAGTCPENYTCLQGYGPNPNYGYTSFDSFGNAFLSSFRLMTQDFWESLYQQILRSAGPWHMLFFIVIIFLGSYYLVNLILAIVAMSYDALQKTAKAEEMADAAELVAIEAEEAARAARDKVKASREFGRGSSNELDPTPNSASVFSSRSYEIWGRDQGVEGTLKVTKPEDTEGEFPSKLTIGTATSAIKIDSTSLSLPSSPFYNRRSSLASGKDRLMVLSMYRDAQEHFPYADDSLAVTPMSEENGAVILPIERPKNPSILSSFALGSRVSSYNSHASRCLSYVSHEGRLPPVTGMSQSITKGSRLKQRAKHLYGLGRKYSDAGIPGCVDTLGNGGKDSGEKQEENQNSETGIELKNVLALNEMIDQAAGRARVVPEDAEEPVTLKEKIKRWIVQGCIKCLDIFCLWDCGFPWSVFQKAVAFIVFDAFTELFITLSIVVNTVFMSMDHYGIEEKPMSMILKAGNTVFTTIFTLECAMKVIGMSPKFYFQVGWNVFDFIIVAFSLIEVVFEDYNLPGIGALRSFRLLRVFKLAKSWPALNMIITIMGKTVGALSNLVFVLVIIIFIFAVMGNQLFAQNYFDKTHYFPGGELPRWNFTDFGHSFLIVFRVLCGEWIESMWDCMLVNGGICVPFFLATVVIGNLVVLNLFLALLLSSFGASSLAPSTDEPNKLAEAFLRFGRFFAWVKGGVRGMGRFLVDLTGRMKSRIVPQQHPPQEVDVEAGMAPAGDFAGPRKKKRRLANTAQLVILSKRLAKDSQRENSEDVLENAETFSMKSYNSHTHYPSQKRPPSGSGVGRKEGSSGEEEEEEDNGGSECVSSDEEENKGDVDCEAPVPPEEEKLPAPCMPPGFYTQFPLFDVDDTSFGVAWTNLRTEALQLIENQYFETAVIVLILLSSLALALEDVNLPSNPILTDCLFHMDRIFTVIFFLEMLLKWIAMGFVLYFQNAWCWLDFVIVMVSLINYVATLVGFGSVSAFKTMRTLRALRPLRAMSRMQGMRIVVNALIGAIPSIMNVLLVCLIFWLIFAIMGVQLFSGKFHKCLDPEDGSRPDYRVIQNKVECLANNFTWENSVMNFDHVGKAYLCLFQVATFKGWIGIMNDAIDSREIDEQPHREVSFIMYGYFVVFIIFGSFFTLNMFVGVIIDNFNEQKKKSGGSMEMFMTEDQKKYYSAMQKMGNKKPIKAVPKPTWKPQALVFAFVTNQKFDMVIMVFIGCNMILMMLDHYQMSQDWEHVLGMINSIFVAVFTAECVLKIFALRHHYFAEPWNLFDAVVVFLSVAGMMLSDLIEKYFVSPTLLRVVRVAKVGRVLRLVKGAKGIRTLLFALAMSLPALFNICLLLFLVMFIFSIFGMSFFMNVKLRGALDSVYNFQTFGQSIILLFQISTSAGWDGVLDGIMNEDDCEEPDPELGKSGDCGNATAGIAFLLAYLVMTFLIIINMYIAVILENYSQATEEVQDGLTDDDYDMYYEIWSQFDPDGTQYVRYDQLSDFLGVLEAPLQMSKPNKFKIISMDIPICKGDLMYCVDILDALTKDFFARKGNPIEEPAEVNEVAIPVDRPGYEPISSTLWRPREEYCASLIQRVWRRYKCTDSYSKPEPPTLASSSPMASWQNSISIDHSLGGDVDDGGSTVFHTPTYDSASPSVLSSIPTDD